MTPSPSPEAGAEEISLRLLAIFSPVAKLIDSERAKAKGLVEALREIGEYTMDHCGGGEIEYIKETELFKEALKQYQGDGK